MTLARASAAITGLACIALGTVSVTGPPVPDENWGSRGALVNALGLVAFAALAVALQLLPHLLDLTRLGRTGQRIAQTGLVLMVIESTASQAHGGNTLGFVFMLGLLLTLAGLAIVGVDGLRRRRWLAPLPFLALLLGIAGGDHGGFLILGLTGLGVAVLASATPTAQGDATTL